MDNLKRAHNFFFFSGLTFAGGIVLASLGIIFLYVAAIAVAAAVFFYNKKFLLLIIIFLPMGYFYYSIDDFYYRQTLIPFNKKTDFKGVVISDPKISLNSQNFYLELDRPYKGKISVKTAIHPSYKYGDMLAVKGAIKPVPENDYGRYLEKERVQGTIFMRNSQLLAENRGNFLLIALLKIKNYHVAVLRLLLDFNQAALLAGMTAGDTGELSNDLLDKLSLSGLRHLVALSGLHMMVMVAAVSSIFYFLFPLRKKAAFVFVLLAVLSFVAMTGFQPSAARAAFMAGVFSVAGINERRYLARNAITAAGLVLILLNPKIMAFDIGFQLSFLAIIGIIYLVPALSNYLRLRPDSLTVINIFNNQNSGFLWWKQTLLMTIGAQLATAPLLINYFSNFTLTSLLANLLVLATVPIAMVLGFLLAPLYYLSPFLAIIIGWLAAAVLDYQIFVIEIAAKFALPFNPNLNWWLISGYYLLLAGLVFYDKYRQKPSLSGGFHITGS